MSTVSLHRSSRERTSPSQVGVLLPPPLPGHTLSPFSPHLSGFLLDLATVVGSVGVTVQEATIQGDAEFCPTCKVAEGHDFEKGGRVFRCSIGAGLGHGAISDHGWGVAVCMSSTTVLLHPHPCVGPSQVSALQGRSEAGEYPVPPEFLSDSPISSTFPPSLLSLAARKLFALPFALFRALGVWPPSSSSWIWWPGRGTSPPGLTKS